MGGLANAYGLRRLLDAQQRFYRAGQPVYYVVSNFPVSQEFMEIGQSYTPVVGSETNVGTSKTVVSPPPSVGPEPSSNSAGAADLGGDLRIGTRLFSVSHTWVKATKIKFNFSKFSDVFDAPIVLGFQYDGTLYNIKNYDYGDMFGDIVDWTVRGTTNEIK